MKMTCNVWKVFLESWKIISRRNSQRMLSKKKISLYSMILWRKHKRVLKLLSIVYTWSSWQSSVIYLTQNLFHKNQRALSLNSDYMVIFKNPQDNSQFVTTARQTLPDKWSSLCGVTKTQNHLDIPTLWLIHLYIYQCRSIFLSICLSIHLSIYLICLSIYLSIIYMLYIYIYNVR